MLSLALLFCDHRYHAFVTVRHQLTFVVVLTGRIVNSPVEWLQSLTRNLISHNALIKSNEQLRSKLLLINTDLQRLRFLEQENAELKALLGVTQATKNKVITAEVVTRLADKFTHNIVINRGERHGVYVGQPVLDAYGLVGQVTAVKPEMSVVMLITHNKSAVPVMVVRSGLPAIVIGVGSDCLELANVPETADVKMGDILVTSGLGKVFPAGYQVGIIKEVRKVLSERFMKVLITPKAHVDKSRYLFLVSAQSSSLRGQ